METRGDIGARESGELRQIMFLLGAILDQEPTIENGKITLDPQKMDAMAENMDWGIRAGMAEDGSTYVIEKVTHETVDGWKAEDATIIGVEV